MATSSIGKVIRLSVKNAQKVVKELNRPPEKIEKRFQEESSNDNGEHRKNVSSK